MPVNIFSLAGLTGFFVGVMPSAMPRSSTTEITRVFSNFDDAGPSFDPPPFASVLYAFVAAQLR